MATIADLIGKDIERQLRGTVRADELLTKALNDLIRDCQENPVEPTRVVVVKARPLTPEARGRGWRRASGKLK